MFNIVQCLCVYVSLATPLNCSILEPSPRCQVSQLPFGQMEFPGHRLGAQPWVSNRKPPRTAGVLGLHFSELAKQNLFGYSYSCWFHSQNAFPSSSIPSQSVLVFDQAHSNASMIMPWPVSGLKLRRYGGGENNDIVRAANKAPYQDTKKEDGSGRI